MTIEYKLLTHVYLALLLNKTMIINVTEAVTPTASVVERASF
jgi:hypothetical protein